MPEPTITCPSCRTEIRLTESLAAPLLESTRARYEAQLARQAAEFGKREAALAERQARLDADRASLDEEVARRLKAESGRIAAEEARKARLALADDLEARQKEICDLRELLDRQQGKLAEAQQAQAELIRKQRELDEARRELDLTVEKRVEAGLANVRQKARLEAEDELKLKLSEKDQLIHAMQKQVEELKRRAEQGSQQLQGEVQELELESLLTSRFPRDTIEPVPKGQHGGDTLQRVVGPVGDVCGTILWECKRTKHWSDGWLAKLREDQRAARADLAVLVSQALPGEVEAFDLIDHVYVVHPRLVTPVAATLRHALIDVGMARHAAEGRDAKMELVYEYLTGPRFRQRVQAIVEAFSSMQQDLDKERRAILKQWAKREAQIERVMQATIGMYGDLQGIAGRSLKEIEGLGFDALEGPAVREDTPEEASEETPD
ncbi:MAG TPA: DUF2130 domain-containing protein [Steroidobacteraceae bacterium]|nr:DUF2130 domain-containing protein [Steroidobacteraceae bacterium]